MSDTGRPEAVVERLLARGLIVPAQREPVLETVTRALAEPAPEQGPPEQGLPERRPPEQQRPEQQPPEPAGVRAALTRERAAEVAGYVGAAFVVAAVALFVVDRWPALTVTPRVLLLAGTALLLATGGVLLGVLTGGVAELAHGSAVRRRLASTLFTGAAAAATGAVVVFGVHTVEQRSDILTDGAWVGLAGSVTMLLLSLAGYLLAPSLLGQLALAASTGYTIVFALDAFGQIGQVELGALVCGAGALWLVAAERRWWHEPAAGRVVGALLLVVGAQIPLGSQARWAGYLATILVGAAGFGLYVTRRHWPYLALGVAGVTLAVPEALLDWTEGALGVAGLLLVAGLSLLGASLAGLRLRQGVAR
jgi:hypothetical protein